MARLVTAAAAQTRSAENKATDKAALQAIAQAAVDVELFTIPLYMTSLYSIQGMHPITGKNTDFYAGRLWPGAKASAHPISGNERAFNIVFSVFIQEMLHLQMAANMATAIGVTPKFTGGALQDANFGWTCYGATQTVIPDIIDLKDTVNEDVTVELGPLDEHRIRLFLAIEQPEDDARAAIKPDKLSSYFPQVPFQGWSPGDALPMFGTIGWMYQCYYDYLSLRYDDGTSLWDAVFDDGAIQNDLFNNFSSGHPMREFMGFETTIALTDKAIAFSQMVAMMDAITDQGEGSEIKKPSANMFQAVMPRYQPRDEALRADYPSYSDKGVQIPSADAAARFDNDSLDHYERFQEVRGLIEIGAITTWNQRGAGNWNARDLTSADYDGSNPYNLPTPEEIAGALNTLSADPGAHQQLSQAVVGAIAGVTRVLDTFWASPGQSFPFPSMVGSGDRMSIAWAVTAQTPDLSQGIGAADDVHTLYHACQGLVYDKDTQQDDPDVIIYHSCRGSNGCRSQGGCGFVQPVTGGAQGCGAASGCGTAVAVRSQADR
ncbi:MAG TPA: ferritin-like domain-containing protein, partial [Allosphingosinicella sp.]